MSTISSVFKGYNAKRNALLRSERAVTKHTYNGRLGRVITASAQLLQFDPEGWKEYNLAGANMDKLANIFGFRDFQYHYTKGWRVA